MTIKMSRREIIVRGIQIPIGGVVLLGLGACKGGQSGSSQVAVCADESKMSESDRSTRASMSYVEKSTTPDQVCGGCAFFGAAEGEGSCGTCAVFQGGPVNAQGHCQSWSAKG